VLTPTVAFLKTFKKVEEVDLAVAVDVGFGLAPYYGASCTMPKASTKYVLS